MNGYEMLGIAVANGIIYLLSSGILGIIICCIFTGDSINGADLDSFPKCSWIGGCIVYIIMIFYLQLR